MVSKKAQSKAGIANERRGQQMGDERSPSSKVNEDEEKTPARSGRRRSASKFFADESSQQIASGGEGPSDTSPSVPGAISTDEPLGESGGERVFKARQKAKDAKR